MFKAPKKRKRAAVTRTGSSDEEEEGGRRGASSIVGSNPDRAVDDDFDDGPDGGEGGLLAAQQKIRARKEKKKKKRRSVLSSGGGAMSFDPDGGDGDDDVADQDAGSDGRKERKKKKKKDKKQSRKKDKKRGSGGMGFGGGAMSFHEEADNEDLVGEEYGKGMLVDADAAAAGDDRGGGDSEGTAASMYGAAALEALRSKQKTYVAPRDEKKEEDETKFEYIHTAADSSTTGTAKEGEIRMPKNQPMTKGLGDGKSNFIPLDGSNIVAGDDALAFMEEDDDEREGTADPAQKKDRRSQVGTDRLSNLREVNSSSIPTTGIFGVGPLKTGDLNSSQDNDVDDGGRKWEDEIARRAGLGGDRGRNGGAPSKGSTEGSGARGASLETMRSTIAKTLTHLRQRRDDLGSTYDRRKNEFKRLEDELRRQEEDLQVGGASFEYYQDLRLDVADWVGALRNLSIKVKTVSTAIQEQEIEAAELRRLRMRQREDDAAAILYSKGLLDTVIGRRIEFDNGNNSVPTVDEFGRDTKSAKALARERRVARRRRVKRERSDMMKELSDPNSVNLAVNFRCGSDGEWSDGEIEEQEQRMNALDSALLLAKDELDAKFCSLTNLQNRFRSWEKQEPTDFKSTYAKLSLAEMAAVLVKADTCTKLNLLNPDVVAESLKEPAWVQIVSSYEDEDEDAKDIGKEKPTETVVSMLHNEEGEEKLICILSRKVVLPYLQSILGCAWNGSQILLYNPFSTRETSFILALYKLLKVTLRSNNAECSTNDIPDRFLAAIKGELESTAIIITKTEAVKLLDNYGEQDNVDSESDETKEASTFATTEQVQRLQNLIANVVAIACEIGESPCRDELASLVLMEVVANRLLSILAKWKESGNLGETRGAKVIQDVCTNLKQSGWLDDERLMLQAAPLRVAAQGFKVEI